MSSMPPRLRAPLPWTYRALTGFWLVLLVLGLIRVAISSTREPVAQNPMAGWRKVDAVVLESRVVGSEEEGFAPHVRFQCEAVEGGTVAVSSRVSVTPIRCESWQDAYSYVSRYPVGALVQAYSLRANPAIAVLEPGDQPGWFELLAGIAAFVVGTIGLRMQLRRNASLDEDQRPLPADRTPRPIRAAEEGEVLRGHGYRKSLEKMTGRVPGYREFPR